MIEPFPNRPDTVEVYTLSWTGDHAAGPDEIPAAQVNGRIVVNGTEVQAATASVQADTEGDFLTVRLTISPSVLKFFQLKEDEFYRPLSELRAKYMSED